MFLHLIPYDFVENHHWCNNLGLVSDVLEGGGYSGIEGIFDVWIIFSMKWDQVKAILICLMMVSSTLAEAAQEQDNTFYFNAEVTR